MWPVLKSALGVMLLPNTFWLMPGLEVGGLRPKTQPSQRQCAYALVCGARVNCTRMVLCSPPYWG
jgi:hypothetical protein